MIRTAPNGQLAGKPAERQAAPASAPRARSSLLAQVKRGPIQRPARIVLYGPEGVGKSTFAADAPAPIFLGAEEGTDLLDVSRLPAPRCWDDVLAAVEELTTADHPYRTLVLDTLDALEPLAWAEVCRAHKVRAIEDLDYGKGYTAALDLWRELLGKLDQMRVAKGLHVVALAHTQIRTFRNPAADDFDRYELKLHAKTSGLWKEWADAVLFATFEEATRRDKSGKVRGVSTGARVVHTVRAAAWDAKSRYPMPEVVALDWSEVWRAVERGEPEDAAAISSRIAELLELVDDETRERASKAAQGARGAVELARIENRLRAIVGQQAPAEGGAQ